MSVSAYTGVIPPVVTPFNEDFSIDRESLTTQVRRMIDAGVDGLFALGSSAEVAFLTRENRRAVIETIVKAADGKVPVLVGVIDTTTLRVAEHVADAVELEHPAWWPPRRSMCAPTQTRFSTTSA